MCLGKGEWTMPAAMKRLCNKVGCGQYAEKGGYCTDHGQIRISVKIPERHRLYDRRWRMRRQVYLSDYPWCEDCMAVDVYEAATEIHHLIPHRGDGELFITGKLVGLCKRCHSRRTGRGE